MESTILNHNSDDTMYVIKRNGDKEEVSFDKVTRRIKHLSCDLKINAFVIAQKVCQEIYDGVLTSELDELAAQTCAHMVTEHLDYGILASRVTISNHQKNTSPSFSETICTLYNNKDTHGVITPLISDKLYDIVMKNKEKLNTYIKYERDYNFDYFGFKTLEKAYLMRVNDRVIERPQHMLMRVALGIHNDDFKDALHTYDLMSRQYFIHATPTLYNSGTPRPQLSSCFLLELYDDSISGIYKTLGDCAEISKWSGGIGVNIHKVRANSSRIRGTNGKSTGIVPMLRVFNNTARYVNQCFLPDTPIYTQTGVKNMEDIACGDKLVTNDGTYQEVLKVYNDSVVEQEIIHIQSGVTDCKVTTGHQFLVVKNQKKGLNYNVIKKRLDLKLIKPEYIESQRIGEDDFMMYPIPKYTHDIEEYTEDDCYLYGMLLGDGHITKSKTEYGLTLNQTTKRELCDWVKIYLDENFIHYWNYEKKGSYSIRWSNNHRNKFQRKMLYNDNDEKIIHNSMLHLPKNKIWNIIKGLIRTDGSIGKEIYYYSSSLPLIQSIIYLLMKVEILPQMSIRDRIGKLHVTCHGDTITTKKIAYQLRIPKTEELCNEFGIETGDYLKFLKWDNYLMSRIKSIQKEKYTGDVIEFDIQKNHNYLTPVGLAHNGGKRNGSFAMYLEPWHADIPDFLKLKKNHGNEEERARDLFYALWIPDLFMQRVENDEKWTLMCPDECPGLSDVYGDAFNNLYVKYEKEGKGRKQVNAQELWFSILESQIETGQPYLLYKDSCNRKTNQKNIGIIKCSNLCTEILEVTTPEETAVCNLASLGLPKYVENNQFDFQKLFEVTRVVTKNLNKVIDVNFYPIPEAERSNKRHRPIGIGVQGLADAFALLEYAFDSEEAAKLNVDIFETIYFAALTESMEISKKRKELLNRYILLLNEFIKTVDQRYTLEEMYKPNTIQQIKTSTYYNEDDNVKAKNDLILNELISLNEIIKPIEEELIKFDKIGGAYSTFYGSPASMGILQFDMWNIKPSDRWDWDKLKEDIKLHGIRNSLLLAPMPTASTAQIIGNNEAIEPYTSNIYSRRTLAGEFIVINKHLVKNLQDLDLWDKELKDKIILNQGSIQTIEKIPNEIKKRYKTVWEIKQKTLIDMAVARGAYICQSQSLNLFMAQPTYNKLSSMHFYSWKSGLKTGIYYLRTKAVSNAQQFTIEPEKKNVQECTDEVCVSCSG